MRRRTYDDYAYMVERWIKPVLGKLALTEIKPLDSERVGHSSVKITLDIYSHVQPGMQREAPDQMASLLNRHYRL